MAPLGLLILQKLEIQQNWNSPHGISGFADLQKQKIRKTGASQHGISGVAILVDQHIAWSMSISIASNIPQKRNKSVQWSQKFNKTHCLLTVSRISSTIFQKVRMAAFVHSLKPLPDDELAKVRYRACGQAWLVHKFIKLLQWDSSSRNMPRSSTWIVQCQIHLLAVMTIYTSTVPFHSPFNCSINIPVQWFDTSTFQ